MSLLLNVYLTVTFRLITQIANCFGSCPPRPLLNALRVGGKNGSPLNSSRILATHPRILVGLKSVISVILLFWGSCWYFIIIIVIFIIVIYYCYFIIILLLLFVGILFFYTRRVDHSFDANFVRVVLEPNRIASSSRIVPT